MTGLLPGSVGNVDELSGPVQAVELPETGEPRVDEVLAQLTGLVGTGPTEHVAVFDGVHRGLQECLAGLDTDQT